MISLGIDLGTTYSLVAYINSQGVPTLFPDSENASEYRTPSVVHIGQDGALVGDAVESIVQDEPDFPHARFTKLQIGQPGTALVDHLGREWLPESLSALILKKLIKDVSSFTQEAINNVVITVPANFSDAQRQATRNAAVMAGLPSPVLIEEPIAAATYYHANELNSEETLFVYDLGGGTFDATVLQTADNGLYVLSTEGRNDIGGKNVDEIIAAHVIREFEIQHGSTLMMDTAVKEQIRSFSTTAKLELAKPGANLFSKSLLLTGRVTNIAISRQQLDQMVSGLIDKTLGVSDQCLAASDLDWSLIDRILLVGGSSYLPTIKDTVSSHVGHSIDQMVMKHPHYAVAYGAAMIASQNASMKRSSEYNIKTISSWDLGIRVIDKSTGKPGIKVLIPQNTPLPATETHTFYTTRDDQTRMIIEVIQSRPLEGYESSLGHFAFGPIEDPRKNFPVMVQLAYNTQGIVTVTASDAQSGQKIEQIIDDSKISMNEKHNVQHKWISELPINI